MKSPLIDVVLNLVGAINHPMTFCEGCCTNVLYSWLGHKVPSALVSWLPFFQTKHDVMKLVSERTYGEYRFLMPDCHLITISTVSSISLYVQALLCCCQVNGTKIRPMVKIMCNLNLNKRVYVKIDLEWHSPSSQWRWMQIPVLGRPNFYYIGKQKQCNGSHMQGNGEKANSSSTVLSTS